MNIDKIKSAILNLPEEDRWKLSDWLSEHCNDLWDKEIEEDARNGRLDKLAGKAVEDMENGRCTEL